MSNIIILARPHPFIVSEMKPMLEQTGYTATKLEDINDLPDLLGPAQGAIISLAITSAITETAEEVLIKIRACSPDIPVLFAGLLDFDKASGVLENIAKNMGMAATILTLDTAINAHSVLGNANTLLYVSKDDLSDDSRRRLTQDLVRKHPG